MAHVNEIIGLTLFVLGVLTIAICLAAFVRVQFFEREDRGFNETLEAINALIRTWTRLVVILPRRFRQIFGLIPIGAILIIGGIWILIYKPI